MNHQLVESYIKDQMRKLYGKEVFCENGIVYIGSLMEVVFRADSIVLSGYKSHNALWLNYPINEKDLKVLVCIITCGASFEKLCNIYEEVI